MNSDALELFAELGAEVSIVAEPGWVMVDCRGRVSTITDDHLEQLSRESRLTHLWVESVDVTDAGVLCLAANRGLMSLELCCPNVTGSALAIVKSLPKLKHLGMECIRDVKSGIGFLLGHPSLEGVGFESSDVVFADVVRLLSGTSVDHIFVVDTRVTVAEVRTLDDENADDYRMVTVELGGDGDETLECVCYANGRRQMG